ncbi:MAG TPA: MSHA biogenesis protein MshC [Duganella sp.]|nr:MSHA biogenesis protein MshC [Duganella sp.]
MVELITVIVLVGILGAIGASRFFDNTVFESRGYADQAKSLVRYAQKLAIARNRPVFVRADQGGFAVCFQVNCAADADLATAPSGGNSGSSRTRAYCVLGGAYVSRWLCEARPATVVQTGDGVATPQVNGFYFDAMGRPYNIGDAIGASTFAPMTVTFVSDTSRYQFVIAADTGYVYEPKQ